METITNARRNDITLFMKNLLWFGICLFRDSRKAPALPFIALYVDAPAVSLPADSRPPCTPKFLLPLACHQVNPNAPLRAQMQSHSQRAVVICGDPGAFGTTPVVGVALSTGIR
jgi:hypothetical protein